MCLFSTSVLFSDLPVSNKFNQFLNYSSEKIYEYPLNQRTLIREDNNGKVGV